MFLHIGAHNTKASSNRDIRKKTAEIAGKPRKGQSAAKPEREGSETIMVASYF